MRRSRWIGWLALVLAAIFVVWVFWALRGGQPEQRASNDAISSMGAARNGAADGAGGAISAVETIIASADPRELAGRRVDIPDTPVLDTAGRRAAFWVGPDGNRRVLVVPRPGAVDLAKESGGPARIRKGQRVSITGVIERVSDSPELAQTWELDRSDLERQPVYILADRMNVIATK